MPSALYRDQPSDANVEPTNNSDYTHPPSLAIQSNSAEWRLATAALLAVPPNNEQLPEFLTPKFPPAPPHSPDKTPSNTHRIEITPEGRNWIASQITIAHYC